MIQKTTLNQTPKKYTMLSMYDNYAKYFPKGHKFYLTKKEYKYYSQEIIKLIVYDFIFEGYTYEMFHLNSSLRLEKFKPTRRLVDWKSTNAYRLKYNEPLKIIYYKNFHTGGEIARFKWSKISIGKEYLKNNSNYLFKSCRKVNRTLAKKIQTTNIISKIFNI